MVAILKEPETGLKSETITEEKESSYREEAIRNGHENWILGLLLVDKQFGFERDKTHHFGMIDFDTMNWLVEQFKGKDPNKPLISDLNEFKRELIHHFGLNAGKLGQKYKNPSIKTKLENYNSNFIKLIAGERDNEQTGGATQEELEGWIKKIVFGERPFYKNNDNWADAADEIHNKVKDNKSPFDEVYEYRDSVDDFAKLNTFEAINKYFREDTEGQKLFSLLEDIHGGWRNKVYNQLKGTDVRSDFTLNLDEKLRVATNSLKGLILGTIKTMRISGADLEEFVTKQINTERFSSEVNPELDSRYTFSLIGRLGIMLEDIIERENLSKDVVTILKKVRDDLLYDLKKDANVAPFDALLFYYNDEN